MAVAFLTLYLVAECDGVATLCICIWGTYWVQISAALPIILTAGFVVPQSLQANAAQCLEMVCHDRPFHETLPNLL